MKVKNLVKNPVKLLKLKLIKIKMYKKKHLSNFFKIENAEHELKKAFQIIYKYHINNKKILFLNFSFNKEIKKLFIKTSHIFSTQIDEFNSKTIYKMSSPIEKGRKSKKKNKLIVALNSEDRTNILKKNPKTTTPTIVLQTDTMSSNLIHDYIVFGDFLSYKKKIKDNFFLSLLKVTLQNRKKKS